MRADASRREPSLCNPPPPSPAPRARRRHRHGRLRRVGGRQVLGGAVAGPGGELLGGGRGPRQLALSAAIARAVAAAKTRKAAAATTAAVEAEAAAAAEPAPRSVPRP